jgi:hypothetical protein
MRAIKGKDIPGTAVKAHRIVGLELLHLLDNRLTDGGETVSLTRRPPFTPRKVLGTHFC